MIDDKVQDYAVMNGASYFSPPFFVLSLRNCVFTMSDQRIVSSESAKNICHAQ